MDKKRSFKTRMKQGNLSAKKLPPTSSVVRFSPTKDCEHRHQRSSMNQDLINNLSIDSFRSDESLRETR